MQKTGDLILIVCEGEKTEPAYFEKLRREWKLVQARIEVARNGVPNTPREIVKHALQSQAERIRKSKGNGPPKYDQVWCVFDRDGHANIEAAMDQAKAHKINVAFSVPCFEIWFLLHFNYSARPYQNCGEVIGELEKALGRKYQKGSAPLDLLLSLIEDAIKNAKILENHNADTDTPNPATGIHRLVEALKK